MARHDGGLFSTPRGKVAGIVFGAARTREGKVVTSREYKIPAYTNVQAQQDQRSIFSAVNLIVRAIGYAVYNTIFNRAIAQLPGFTSLMSILMKSMNSALDLSTPVETNLGTLHFPSTCTVSASAATGSVDASFDNDIGDNGDPLDHVRLIVIPKTNAKRLTLGHAYSGGSDDRDSTLSVVVMTNKPALSDHLIVGVYLIGAGQYNSDLLSVVKWYDVTTGA